MLSKMGSFFNPLVVINVVLKGQIIECSHKKLWRGIGARRVKNK